MRYISLDKLRDKLPKRDFFFLILTKTRPTWGTVPIRIAFGVILISHGFNHLNQALAGAHVLSGIPESPFAYFMIFAFSITEMLGGALMISGLMTRAVAGGMAIELFLFTALENLPIGFDAGYEMRVLLILLSIMFALSGGGLFSLDPAISRSLLAKHPSVKHQAYIIAETPYRERWYE